MNQDMKNSRPNLARACVFIDSSNPSTPYQVIDSKIRPLIKLPFPPVIDPADLIVRQSSTNNLPARAPNAFIIYRKVFIDAAHADGYQLPMRIMSSMASQSWEQEPDKVKSEYRRIANEAFNLRNEMFPKSGCRRKRAKWNIVSFKNKTKITKKRQKWNIVSFDQKKSNSSQDNKLNETKKSNENQSEGANQVSSPVKSLFPNPIISQDKSNEQDCFVNFNDFFPSPEMNFDISNDLNSNDTFNEDFACQPSPELSIASSLSPELFDQIECDFDFRYPEQLLEGMFNQNQPDEQFNFQQTKCDDNLFNYYQTPEFNNNNNNLSFACDNENLLNENISSQECFDGFVNYQPDNIESNTLYLYDNNTNSSSNYSSNYSSDGLGIFNTSLESGIGYFQ